MIDIDSYRVAYDLRNDGLKYTEIAIQMGVSSHTARMKSVKYERMKEKPLFELYGKLSGRAIAILIKLGATNEPDAAAAAYRVATDESFGNVGRGTKKEIALYFGVDPATESLLIRLRDRRDKLLTEVGYLDRRIASAKGKG